MATYDTMSRLNYPGSSGYGYNVVSGRYGTGYNPGGQLTGAQAAAAAATTGYPQFDPITGKIVDSNSGKPYNGLAPDGQRYKGGVLDTTIKSVIPGTNTEINPNDPNQRYKPVDIVKSPAVAAGAANLMDTFNKAAQSSLSDFGSVLNQFKTDTAAARTKLNEATDIGPTIATLQGAQSRYGTSLDTAVSDYAAQNAAQAARERGIVTEANRLLPEYDTAAQNIGDRQVQELAKQLSRYKIAGGTPGSMGTDEAQILARGLADVQLPLEQAKIARKMDLLTNLSLPVERSLNAAEVNRIAQFNPAIAGQQFTSTQGTAMAIQSLKSQIAGMSIDAAIKFMQAQGIPASVMNQVLAGQIANLGALGQVEEMSRYRGLRDVLGANLSQPLGYNMATPGYPNTSPRNPTRNPGQPAGQPGGQPGGQPDQGTSTGTDPMGIPYRPIQALTTKEGIARWRDWTPNTYPLQPDNYGTNAPARGGGGGYTVNPDGTVSYMGTDAYKNYASGYGGQYEGWTPEDFTQGNYY